MRCAWCKASLFDEHGRPRWEVFASGPELAFVCYEACRQPGDRRG